ncbi:unnamed protein product [marine sediment metagenome]|uniref:Uncharacterized protein n=1 Tax=marine sediment metagenome TaxID=412755 RepID=X1JBL0_9ZZZZ
MVKMARKRRIFGLTGKELGVALVSAVIAVLAVSAYDLIPDWSEPVSLLAGFVVIAILGYALLRHFTRKLLKFLHLR